VNCHHRFGAAICGGSEGVLGVSLVVFAVGSCWLCLSVWQEFAHGAVLVGRCLGR